MNIISNFILAQEARVSALDIMFFGMSGMFAKEMPRCSSLVLINQRFSVKSVKTNIHLSVGVILQNWKMILFVVSVTQNFIIIMGLPAPRWPGSVNQS